MAGFYIFNTKNNTRILSRFIGKIIVWKVFVKLIYIHLSFGCAFFYYAHLYFFNTMAFAFGENANDLKKVDGILYAFECRDGTK
jgi:hypothetical protein